MTAAAVQIPTSTPQPSLDRALQRVKEGSRAFARLAVRERRQLCEQLLERFRAVAADTVRAACAAKGIPEGSPLAGEEWLAGPVVTVRMLRLLVESLSDVEAHGAPRVDPAWLRELPDGRLAVKVFPHTALDAALLGKHEAEVHFQHGVTRENLRAHQARFYQAPHEGRVCLVLGAGNVNAIPPTDCLTKLFVEGTVCVLKMNPVNAYLGPLLEQAFQPLVERGFLAVVYGGAEEGSYLAHHALVDEVHVTGSDRTHDALVWGVGAEGEARRARKEKLLQKPIHSELGNITPVLVVPGPWTDGERAFQAQSVAGMVANNASFNCNSAKLLVTARGWAGRGPFVDSVEGALGKAPPRSAWYPGAEQRWGAFVEGRERVTRVGSAQAGELPWAVLRDVDPKRLDDRVFRQEPWCAVLSETTVEAEDPVSYLEAAVDFVNGSVWGTLAAMVVVSDATLKLPGVAAAFEKALQRLRYGGVAVNTWAGTLFALGTTPWGGHPSTTPEDIQSGRGFVHNTLMFESIEKVIIRAPAANFPALPWFPGHRTAHVLGERLTAFEAEPSWLKVPGLALAGLRA